MGNFLNFLALSRQGGKKRTGAFFPEDMHGSGFAPAPLSSHTHRPCLSGGPGSVLNLPGVRKAVPAGGVTLFIHLRRAGLTARGTFRRAFFLLSEAMRRTRTGNRPAPSQKRPYAGRPGQSLCLQCLRGACRYAVPARGGARIPCPIPLCADSLQQRRRAGRRLKKALHSAFYNSARTTYYEARDLPGALRLRGAGSQHAEPHSASQGAYHDAYRTP